MAWQKHNSSRYVAFGSNGNFIVEKHGGLWWGSYVSLRKRFHLPPKNTLREAKSLCEENAYWEEQKYVEKSI